MKLPGLVLGSEESVSMGQSSALGVMGLAVPSWGCAVRTCSWYFCHFKCLEQIKTLKEWTQHILLNINISEH